MKTRSKIDAYGDGFCPPVDTPDQMEACKHCTLPMRMCMGLANPEKCKAAYLAPGKKGTRHSVDYTYQTRTVEEMYDAVVRPLLGRDADAPPEDATVESHCDEARRLRTVDGIPVVETLRRKKGVSQMAMANHLGISLKQIGRYCTGTAGKVPPERLQKIANYFGASVEEIAK